MIYISHRGNIEGPNPELENSVPYIEKALSLGYEVEIDVWLIKEKYYLGHDNPQYKVEKSFLTDNRIWCHAKNLEALEDMRLSKNIRFFWHQEDDATLTSDNFIWTFPGKMLVKNSICVMPERSSINPSDTSLKNCVGVCSDFIKLYKEAK